MLHGRKASLGNHDARSPRLLGVAAQSPGVKGSGDLDAVRQGRWFDGAEGTMRHRPTSVELRRRNTPQGTMPSPFVVKPNNVTKYG